MAGNIDEDDFGGFEEATSVDNAKDNLSLLNSLEDLNIKNNISKAKPQEKIPDWVLQPSISPISPVSAKANTNMQANQIKKPVIAIKTGNNDNSLAIKQLQDELSLTKEQLIDQQTMYLQLQAQHRQDLEDKNNLINKSINTVYKEFQVLLEKKLNEQKEIYLKEFKSLIEKQNAEYEKYIVNKISEIHKSYETQFNERFENKIVEIQEQLISHNVSEYENLEMKVTKLVKNMVKDEQASEKVLVKQNFDKLEKELKSQTEGIVQNMLINQSEMFKEQIKSGVMQENLIHKDLINSKLERLFKASEEKRKKTNILFARHMSSLNFFIDNAHKQFSILREAQKDLLKNKDIVDYYGDVDKSFNDSKGMGDKDEQHRSSLLSLSSLSGIGIKPNLNKNNSKDNLFSYEAEDDQLIDENLLQDLS